MHVSRVLRKEQQRHAAHTSNINMFTDAGLDPLQMCVCRYKQRRSRRQELLGGAD
jgi:hypothetical protein